MPVAAIQMMLGGDVIGGVLSVVLGTPMFYYFGKRGREINREARNFRRYLRANHHWMSAGGVLTRLAVPVLVVLAVIADILLYDPMIWQDIVMGLFLLAISSLVSTMMSSFGNAFAGSQSAG